MKISRGCGSVMGGSVVSKVVVGLVLGSLGTVGGTLVASSNSWAAPGLANLQTQINNAIANAQAAKQKALDSGKAQVDAGKERIQILTSNAANQLNNAQQTAENVKDLLVPVAQNDMQSVMAQATAGKTALTEQLVCTMKSGQDQKVFGKIVLSSKSPDGETQMQLSNKQTLVFSSSLKTNGDYRFKIIDSQGNVTKATGSLSDLGLDFSQDCSNPPQVIYLTDNGPALHTGESLNSAVSNGLTTLNSQFTAAVQAANLVKSEGSYVSSSTLADPTVCCPAVYANIPLVTGMVDGIAACCASGMAQTQQDCIPASTFLSSDGTSCMTNIPDPNSGVYSDSTSSTVKVSPTSSSAQ